MWLSYITVALPFLAAVAAAWGLWQRKWYAFVPAVAAGLAAIVPTKAGQWLIDQIAAVAVHAEPRTLVMTGLLVDAAAFASLVSLWAGWSRGHWFWRLTALAGVPAALSLVRANEPILLSSIVMPLLAAAAWLARRRRDKRSAAVGGTRPRFRWQLRDALLLFVPLGLIALAIRSVVGGPLYIVAWEQFLTLAAALVCLALSAAATGGAQAVGWRWISGVVCLGFAAGVAAVFLIRDNDVLGLAYYYDQQTYIGDVAPGLFLLAVLGIPLAIVVTSGIYAWSAKRNAGVRFDLVSKSLLWLAIGLLGVPLLVVGWWMRPPATFAQPLPPSETYERLLLVGERLERLGPAGRPTAAVAAEVQEVAMILQEPGHVWFDARRFADLELSGQYRISIEALSQITALLEVETARAEARGDHAHSVQLAELQFSLAEVLSRGGVMMHWFLVRRARSYGRRAIERAAPHLLSPRQLMESAR